MLLLRLAASLAVCVGLAAADNGATPGAAPAMDPKLSQDASYLIGRDIAGKIGGIIDQLGLDRDRLLAGVHEALEGKPSAIPEDKAQEVMQRFQEGQQAMAEAKSAREAADAPLRKERNAAFLAENGKKPAVTTTASGLQYEVLASGAGKVAGPTAQVRVNYEGRLLDGTVFDASARHGGPMTFRIGEVIAGWNEAVAMMKEGDKWRLWIPSELAYGESSQGPIGANQLLVFEVELVEVLPADGAPSLTAPRPSP